MKNTILEMKNTHKGINSKLNDSGGSVSSKTEQWDSLPQDKNKNEKK